MLHLLFTRGNNWDSLAPLQQRTHMSEALQWLQPLMKEAMAAPKQLMTESMVSLQQLNTETMPPLPQAARCTLLAPLAVPVRLQRQVWRMRARWIGFWRC